MKENHLKIIFGVIITLLFYNSFLVNCSNKNRFNEINKKADSIIVNMNRQYVYIDSLNRKIDYLQKDVEMYNLQYLITKQSVNNKDVTIKQINSLLLQKEKKIKEIINKNESNK